MPNYSYNPYYPVQSPNITAPNTNPNWAQYIPPVNNLYSQTGTMPNQYSYAPNNARNQNIVWVTGRNGAEAYHMEPNTRAILMDSNEQVFYIKSVGPDGRPDPLMAFKYEPLNLNLQNGSSETGANMDMSNYVTRKDFEELKAMIDDLTKPSGNKHNG